MCCSLPDMLAGRAGAQSVSAATVKQINDVLAAQTLRTPAPITLDRVSPPLLLPPLTDPALKAAVTADSVRLGDVVVVASGLGDKLPPFGTPGVAVAVHDGFIEVLCTREFAGGSDLEGRIASKKGALVPLSALVNVTQPSGAISWVSTGDKAGVQRRGKAGAGGGSAGAAQPLAVNVPGPSGAPGFQASGSGRGRGTLQPQQQRPQPVGVPAAAVATGQPPPPAQALAAMGAASRDAPAAGKRASGDDGTSHAAAADAAAASASAALAALKAAAVHPSSGAAAGSTSRGGGKGRAQNTAQASNGTMSDGQAAALAFVTSVQALIDAASAHGAAPAADAQNCLHVSTLADLTLAIHPALGNVCWSMLPQPVQLSSRHTSASTTLSPECNAQLQLCIKLLLCADVAAVKTS